MYSGLGAGQRINTHLLHNHLLVAVYIAWERTCSWSMRFVVDSGSRSVWAEDLKNI